MLIKIGPNFVNFNYPCGAFAPLSTCLPCELAASALLGVQLLPLLLLETELPGVLVLFLAHLVVGRLDVLQLLLLLLDRDLKNR